MGIWNKFVDGSADVGYGDSMDTILSSSDFSKRVAKSVKEGNIGVGSRVKLSFNIESMIMYPNLDFEEVGTVVRAKTASMLPKEFTYVKWDSGSLMSIGKRYLEPVVFGLKGNFMKISASEMSQFVRSNNTDGLVHKSSRDLWSVSKEDDGGYVLSRLFDGKTGVPLKEQE